MATNKYFRSFQNPNEQKLLDKLIQEAIRIAGIDTVYIPRNLNNPDTILGEDVLSSFETIYPMEMYYEDFERFGGQGDFLAKFNLQVDDILTTTVSVNVFQTSTQNTMLRPMEGDLIFFPLTKKLFEITHVEDETAFFQLGKLYTYKLSSKLYTYTEQKISTGEPDIDMFAKKNQYTIEMILGNGIGDYRIGEKVYQGVDLESATATGEITFIKDNVLSLSFVSGIFVPQNGLIKGESANYEMVSIDYSVDINKPSDNKQFLDEGETLLEYNPNNPFGFK